MRVLAGLTAAVLAICGCASAGVSHASAIPPPARSAAVSAVRQASGQLVTVTAASYGATQAKLTAYQREDGRWHRVFGPWTAWIGRRGMAPAGAKREGDGRTPSGTFGFGFFFGVDPDPGVQIGRAHV